MTLIKICGLKRDIDIEYVNKCLPDYIGFVFAKSKRQVTVDEAIILSGKLDSRIKKVGVFVNESILNVIKICISVGLDCIQIHGDETIEYFNMLTSSLIEFLGGSEKTPEIWKSIRVKDYADIKDIENYNVDAILLDTFSENYGGAGKTFDWNIAKKAKQYGKLILAGGLNSQNVETAIQMVEPYIVDISSGVETDGFKDYEKIKQFIDTVRGY